MTGIFALFRSLTEEYKNARSNKGMAPDAEYLAAED